MREAAEARDDVAMLLRILAEAGEYLAMVRGDLALELQEAIDGHFLVVERFGVLQRHVEEHALDRRQLEVHHAADAIAHQVTRAPVVAECLGGAAIDVPAHLVEQDQHRQPAARRLRPEVQLALGGGGHERAPALAHGGITFRVGAEPEAMRPGTLDGSRTLSPNQYSRISSAIC
jgi:hypothetical protein